MRPGFFLPDMFLWPLKPLCHKRHKGFEAMVNTGVRRRAKWGLFVSRGTGGAGFLFVAPGFVLSAIIRR